jgi:hypothetical protein
VVRQEVTTMKCHTEKNHDGVITGRLDFPLRKDSYEFCPHDVDVMDFLVDRHLNRKHHQGPVEILAYAADLLEAVDELSTDMTAFFIATTPR